MKKLIYTLTFTTLFLWSCATDEKADNNIAYAEIVSNLAQNVIVGKYDDLNKSAEILHRSIVEFKEDPTEGALVKVKEEWKNTRRIWEQTECFLFGPVDQEGIDPALDTWPVDVELITKILNGDFPITLNVLAQNEEAKGFHLIEYLVWGNEGNKKAEDFTGRELELLSVAAEDMNNNTNILANHWKEGQGNYVGNFTAFGENSVYPTPHAAIEEFVESIIDLLDELVNGKIGDPLNIDGGESKTELEESRFSNNSRNDFINNYKGIQNLLKGSYKGNTGKGLSHFIAAKDKELSDKIDNSLIQLISQLEKITPGENESVFRYRNELSEIVKQTENLFNLFEDRVVPLFSGND